MYAFTMILFSQNPNYHLGVHDFKFGKRAFMSKSIFYNSVFIFYFFVNIVKGEGRRTIT
jgi:hypothetical protein